MKQKKAYKRETLIPITTVAGNISDFKQQYEIKFYPKADDLPDKVALYIYLAREDKQFAKRSIYFSSYVQLKQLIIDLTQAYFFFKDKKSEPDNRELFRMLQLDDFLTDIKTKQLSIWSGK